MDKARFVEKVFSAIQEIQNNINEMPYRGDKCKDSQKLCLQLALNELEHNVTGLEDEDFKELEDEDEG